jgi:ferrochelatase
MISRRRSVKVQEYYRRIGGKSPILKLTRRQAAALERELVPRMDARVFIAMRYWHPLTVQTVGQIIRDGIRRVVLLPLYPQYSRTTTGSSVNEWRRVLSRARSHELEVDVIEEYPDHPLYVSAIVRNVSVALNRIPVQNREEVHLVFSAHGTPMKLVRAGDPYQAHIVRTYQSVLKEGNFGLRHHLCYQSKVGPERWLEPSLEKTIHRLAADRVSHVIVVPIAFVSDHSETLWEINIQMKEMAKGLGIRHYDMSPALNTNPLFIRALADLVMTKVDGGKQIMGHGSRIS